VKGIVETHILGLNNLTTWLILTLIVLMCSFCLHCW